VRLPLDRENWTGRHAERAIAEAWRKFDRYEKTVNFDWPRERQDECYRPYFIARQLALEVSEVTRQCLDQARLLP
jgi:hypothetical protein